MSTSSLTNIPTHFESQYPLKSDALVIDTSEFDKPEDTMEMLMMSRQPPLLKQIDLNAWENDTESLILEDRFNITQYCENVSMTKKGSE